MLRYTVPKTSNARFVLSLVLVMLLAPTATDLYLASMPDISSHLKVSYAQVQFTLTVYLLAQGLGQILFGPIIDRFGRRVPLLLGIVCFGAAALWAGASDTLSSLLLSRFVQGLAGALLLVIGFSSVRDRSDGAQAARIFAVLLTIEGLAPIFAPIAGGYIDALLGWRAALWTSAVMAVVTFGNSFINLPESLPKEKRLPLKIGQVLKTYARIASDRHFLLPCLGLSSVFFFLFAYIGGGAYFYQTIHRLSPEHFGLVFGLTGSAVMFGAMLSSRQVKFRQVADIACEGIVLMLVGTIFAFTASLTEYALFGVVAGFMLAMFGLGMAEPTLVSMTMASRKTALGSTAALMGAVHLAIASLSTPVSGYLLPKSGHYWFLLLFLSGLAALGITLAARRPVRPLARALREKGTGRALLKSKRMGRPAIAPAGRHEPDLPK